MQGHFLFSYSTDAVGYLIRFHNILSVKVAVVANIVIRKDNKLILGVCSNVR